MVGTGRTPSMNTSTILTKTNTQDRTRD